MWYEYAGEKRRGDVRRRWTVPEGESAAVPEEVDKSVPEGGGEVVLKGGAEVPEGGESGATVPEGGLAASLPFGTFEPPPPLSDTSQLFLNSSSLLLNINGIFKLPRHRR